MVKTKRVYEPRDPPLRLPPEEASCHRGILKGLLDRS